MFSNFSPVLSTSELRERSTLVFSMTRDKSIIIVVSVIMSAGQVRSRFGDVSDSTSRSYQSTAIQLISDRSGYSALVSQPIFRSVGFQVQPDLTGSGSGLNIVKPDSTRSQLDQA